MSVPADDGVVREWTKFEDEQLQGFHREGKTWMKIGQGLGRTAGECLARCLEIHGSLLHPCPRGSAAFPRDPGEIDILTAVRYRGKE